MDAAVFYEISDTVDLQLNIENLLDTSYFSDAHNNFNISPGCPVERPDIPERAVPGQPSAELILPPVLSEGAAAGRFITTDTTKVTKGTTGPEPGRGRWRPGRI